MADASIISIEELNEFNSLMRTQELVTKLTDSNVDAIIKANRTELILPLDEQVIILLFLGYKYSIPVITLAALYQLYANDLIVIALTLLDSLGKSDEIIANCREIKLKLENKSKTRIVGDYLGLYAKLLHFIYEGKIYIPANIW